MKPTEDLRWIADLTEDEVKAKYIVVESVGSKELAPESRSWSVERKPLKGDLTYQVAITAAPQTDELRLQRQAHPEVPVSGDLRSGCMILQGDQVIASLMMGEKFRMAVSPEHRRQGLSQELLTLWCASVKRLVQAPKQPITAAALALVLRARETLAAAGRVAPHLGEPVSKVLLTVQPLAEKPKRKRKAKG